MKNISGKIVEYKVSGPVGKCQVQLYRPASGHSVFVATELPDNPGPSITNAAEQAFYAACVRFSVLPEQVMWIEHYLGDDLREDQFDLVQFELNSEGAPFSPRWSPLGLSEAMKMTGGTVEELTGHGPSEDFSKAEHKKILDQAIKDAIETEDDEVDDE